MLHSQKVGVVFSGGGASGLSFVGALKALEENHIPIHYFTGTSIGSVFGGLYAIGLSPKQIDSLVNTKDFLKIINGEFYSNELSYFKNRETYAKWLSLKLNLNNSFMSNLPSNFINSIPIDYFMMKMFLGANLAIKSKFDNLFIPFRCIGSDIATKQTVIFKQGDLASSIRASMSYPFYLPPIFVNNSLMLDGGLYNNFPLNIIEEEFHPDFIIGITAADSFPTPKDDDLSSQIRAMLTINSNNTIQNKTQHVIIKPWSDLGVFNFNNIKAIIDSGYVATMRMMPEIKKHITQYENEIDLTKRRQTFLTKTEVTNFKYDSINIVGGSLQLQNYIKQHFLKNGNQFTLHQFKKSYYNLISDECIIGTRPTSYKDTLKNKKILQLYVKPEKRFVVDVGGFIVSKPISTVFLNLNYTYINKIKYSAAINGFASKLLVSSLANIKFDFPTRIPFYIETQASLSRWDYFNSSSLFLIFEQPSYMIQDDRYLELNASVPLGNIGKSVLSIGSANFASKYFQNQHYINVDSADITTCDFQYTQLAFEFTTLNQKQFATKGFYASAYFKQFYGYESYLANSNKNNVWNTPINNLKHNWTQIKFNIESYIPTIKKITFGLQLDGALNNQTLFSNFTSSMLMAPAYEPIPEMQTIIQEKFRSNSFIAGGVKLIFEPLKKFQLRFENYFYQPFVSFEKLANNKVKYSTPFANQSYVSSFSLVYQTPIGPIALSNNVYNFDLKNATIFFHIGYIIFNKKSIK